MKFKKVASLPEFSIGSIDLQHGDVVPEFSGSQAPSPVVLEDGNMRIYFSARDNKKRSLPFYYDIDREYNVIGMADSPIIPLGAPGEADEDGVMPSQVIENTLYYTGWNRVDNSTGARYRTACMSVRLGDPGTKLLIFDRLPIAPCGTSMPFLEIIESDDWGLMKYRVHFMSYKYWKNNEPYYTTSYQESSWGDSWFGEYIDTLPNSAARPVVFEGKIFYSERANEGYRLDKGKSYKMFYNSSKLDDPVLIEIDGGEDDLMQAYGYPIKFDNKTVLLYNNTFTGSIQIAELIE